MITYARLTQPTAEDHAQLSQLILELTPRARHLSLSDLRVVASSHILLVARDQSSNLIVGTALLAVMRTVSHVNGQIEDVVVAQTHRGKGIGRTLTEHLIACAREAGVERIDLGSEAHREVANTLYRSLGFVQRETNLYRLAL